VVGLFHSNEVPVRMQFLGMVPEPSTLTFPRKVGIVIYALIATGALCVIVPICALLIGTLFAWVVEWAGVHLGEYGSWMGLIFALYAAYADIVIGPVFWWRLSAKKLGLAPLTNKRGTISVATFFSLTLIWVLWGEQAISNPPHLEDVSDDGRYVLAQEYLRGSSSIFFRIDTRTGAASPLTMTGHGFDSFANFSPDGSQIVFAHSDDEKNYTIMLADASGSNPHALLAQGGNDSSPRFSQDGRTIYFIRTEGNGIDLFSSTLDGKVVTQLTHERYTSKLGPYLRAGPVVSPDGKQMVYVTVDDRLQLCSLSGTNQKPADLLFPLPGTPSSRNYVSAYFSPDSKAILFMAATDGKDRYGYDIYRLEIDSREVRNLTRNHAYASDFCLSVGGKEAVFLKWKFSRFQRLPRSFQLELMDMQSGSITPINITGLPK
jgi:dipeptidyl aminopeptidase/acylaminoacyl peptidase